MYKGVPKATEMIRLPPAHAIYHPGVYFNITVFYRLNARHDKARGWESKEADKHTTGKTRG